MPRPTDADRDLATVLRRLREERGHSQEQLAHDAGVTVGTLARIERAQANPTWTTVRRIAEALDVSLVELAQILDARGPRRATS